MLKHVITASNTERSPIKDRVFKGETKQYQIDFAPWAEDNVTVITAIWLDKSGTVNISGEQLSSNLATANIYFQNEGRTLIEISGTDGTQSKKAYLDIQIVNPNTLASDYE